MITEDSAPLAIDIAKSFMRFVNDIDPKWQKAYLRYSYQDAVGEIRGSYVNKTGVSLIDSLTHKDFFRPTLAQAKKLLQSLNKSQGVFLLIVNSKKEYEFKLENKNMSRWKISKMDGATGIPEGEE